MLANCKPVLVHSVDQVLGSHRLEVFVLREIAVKRLDEIDLLPQCEYSLLGILRDLFADPLLEDYLSFNLLLNVFNCFLLNVPKLLDVHLML